MKNLKIIINMPLDFIKSERGKVYDGFLYRFESKKDEKTI